jgi:uncharacterized protein YqgQ
MSKEFSEKMGEMIKIMFELNECAKKNCSSEKNNIMANKKTAELYIKYTTETNNENKIKLLNQIYKNNIIHDYNKCMIKNCKTIYNDIIKFLRSLNIATSQDNKINEDIETMINEIEKLYNKSNLTKKDYNTISKNIVTLMTSINKLIK